jgi:hypothetical protein
VDSADVAPTAQAMEAFETYQRLVTRQLERWTTAKSKDLEALNTLLRQRGFSMISLTH